MQAAQADTASASSASSMLDPSMLRLKELKKGRADPASSSPNPSQSGSGEEDSDGSKRSGGGGDSSFPSVKFSPRNASSKYDFVKVTIMEPLRKWSQLSEISLVLFFRCRLNEMFFALLLQVKVWLGDNCDHYYVLSRFLLSRMLTVTKVCYSLFGSFIVLRFQLDFMWCPGFWLGRATNIIVNRRFFISLFPLIIAFPFLLIFST